MARRCRSRAAPKKLGSNISKPAVEFNGDNILASPRGSGELLSWPDYPPSRAFNALVRSHRIGGAKLVTVFHAYFDESGSDEAAPAISVAGYVFDSDRIEEFNDAWHKELARWGVATFHMTDCGARRAQFAHMKDEECAQLVRSLVEIIVRFKLIGTAAITVKQDYRQVLPEELRHWTGSDYTDSLLWGVSAVRQWLQSHNNPAPVTYYVDRGNQFKAEAELQFNILADTIGGSGHFQYYAHSFIPMQGCGPLQAADLLAWEWRKYYVDTLKEKKRKIRKSLEALLVREDMSRYHIRDKELFQDLVQFIESADPIMIRGPSGE